MAASKEISSRGWSVAGGRFTNTVGGVGEGGEQWNHSLLFTAYSGAVGQFSSSLPRE